MAEKSVQREGHHWACTDDTVSKGANGETCCRTFTCITCKAPCDWFYLDANRIYPPERLFCENCTPPGMYLGKHWMEESCLYITTMVKLAADGSPN